MKNLLCSSLSVSVCLSPSLSLSLSPFSHLLSNCHSPSPLASTPPPTPFTTHKPTLQYLSVAAVGGRDPAAEGGTQFAQQETGASQGESPHRGGQWTVIWLSLLSTALLDFCQQVGHLFCFCCYQQLPQYRVSKLAIYFVFTVVNNFLRILWTSWAEIPEEVSEHLFCFHCCQQLLQSRQQLT